MRFALLLVLLLPGCRHTLELVPEDRHRLDYVAKEIDRLEDSFRELLEIIKEARGESR